MRNLAVVVCLLLSAMLLSAEEQLPASGGESQFVPVVAVLPFESRGRQVEQDKTGKSVSELVFVHLLESGVANLVERAELDKALEELHLSAVGLVSPETQLKLGKLIGAKILITGSLFETSGKKYAVAKLIGTETSRVLGCSVSGKGDFPEFAPELAGKIVALLQKDGEKLLPKKATLFSTADRLAEVKGRQRRVFLKVSEDPGLPVPDPAAEIELKKLLLALDFQVLEQRQEAEFAIICEALASNAGQFQKFSSAAARVELSVYRVKGDELLAAGASKETVAGATYIIAAKDAIGQATLRLAAELLTCLK
jgi:hypothetical protein